MRADLALIEAGLCSSRTQARQLIQEGSVFLVLGSQIITVKKPSQPIDYPLQLKVRSEKLQYVSRGGHKLYGAIQRSGLSVQHARCIDFGQSTGGFTDCLLKLGASHVIGFDVGHDQLHPSLRNHPQVRFFEKVNLKELDISHWLRFLSAQASDFFPANVVVADLSFISIRRVLPNLVGLLPQPASCLFLIKPQFELGPHCVGKNGIVKLNSNIEQQLKSDFFNFTQSIGLNPIEFFPSEITGTDGNQEFFLFSTWPGLPLEQHLQQR